MSASRVVALPFEKAAVLRLIAHAEASPAYLPNFGRPALGPALWLVGDRGIYLMSNGAPPTPANSDLAASGGEPLQRRCYAAGCSAQDPIDAWRPIHQAIRDGDDFCITVDRLADLRDAVEQSNDHVLVVTDGEAWEAFTESEFEFAYERPASGAVN